MHIVQRHILPFFTAVAVLAVGCDGGHRPEAEDPGADFSDLVPPDVSLQDGFSENFSATTSDYFDFSYRIGRDDFRYFSGVPSLSEANTDILMLRIDPSDPAGSGRGPEILSGNHTFYGSYSVRLKLPDIRTVQPNTGAVATFSVYGEDESFGRSEIYIEWRVADPQIVYMGAVTGVSPVQNSISRAINLSDGTVYRTSYTSETVSSSGSSSLNSSGALSGMQAMPAAFADFDSNDASAGFLTCGFDWYPGRIEWWIHNKAGERIILWNYVSTELFSSTPAPAGIPVIPAQCRFEFWHSKLRPTETNQSAVAAPLYEYELEVDNISYEPFADHIAQWQEKYGQ